MTYDMRNGLAHPSTKAYAQASLQRARVEYREARTDMRAAREQEPGRMWKRVWAISNRSVRLGGR